MRVNLIFNPERGTEPVAIKVECEEGQINYFMDGSTAALNYTKGTVVASDIREATEYIKELPMVQAVEEL